MAMKGWDGITAKQIAGMGKQALTPSKFHNVKVQVDGFTFDSKREAQRWHELKLLEKAGQIHGLVPHPAFDLHVNGVKVATYIADFAYFTGVLAQRRIEDVKGVKTAVYQLKKKMLLAEYGIVIQEIR